MEHIIHVEKVHLMGLSGPLDAAEEKIGECEDTALEIVQNQDTEKNERKVNYSTVSCQTSSSGLI